MSIEELTAFIPPPDSPKNTGTPEGWADVEAELGVQLPQDFRDIISTYGNGSFAKEIHVYHPFLNRQLQTRVEQICEEVRVNILRADEEYPVYPEPVGLLPCASEQLVLARRR